MHHLAVAFDEEFIGDIDTADGRNASDIVSSKIEQHQMLGAFLRIGEQFTLQRRILMRRRTARPRAGNRTDGDAPIATREREFRGSIRQSRSCRNRGSKEMAPD